jgi:hypothetical protein
VQNVSLKPSTIWTGLALLVCLAACDGWLLAHSLKQSTVIAAFVKHQATTLPSLGDAVPNLKGVTMSGAPIDLKASESRPLVLLIFREACHFCEANWKNWDQLFGQANSGVSVVLATGDKVLSQSYRSKHPMLNSRQVILGVNDTVLSSIKMGATPQTIYVVDAKVRHDWAGVLDATGMKEIRTTIK